ncbi:hypothetical protein [Nodularia sp. LEGE 04288]|uniref:hypothetical protein n=1 Tax=Nodularia sp. LEGE 04288 TaxID=1828639 RepID=UPI001D11B495|nr:hypothetical protein [Nodularia sp. LEGE 04288]MCC2691563.1 hypothetical protein [Nodularia sp. LEGE 04288]
MTSQDFSDFLDKNLHIDCSKIILRNDKNKPKIYEGTGSITRNSKGELEIELFYLDDNPWMSLCEHIEAIGEKQGNLTVLDDTTAKIGSITEESEYFSLSAFDVQGREWKSMRVLIGERKDNGNQIFLIAQLHEIYSNYSIKENEKASLYLQIYGRVKFPSNIFLASKIAQNPLISTEEKLEYAHFQSAAHFFACNYEFLIKHKDEFTIIEVKSDCDKLLEMIETRICEALQFVLGEFIEWSTLELNEQGNKTIRIQSLYNQNYKPKFKPPIRFEKSDTTEDIWCLYEHYLKYILQHSKKSLHPISGWVRRIFEARALYLESEMLTITVAVESLLKIAPLKEISDVRSDNNKFNDLASQIDIIKNAINDLDIDDNLNKRLEGFLGEIQSGNDLRAIDRLWNLENKGLLDKKLIAAWKYIRNRAAHGYVLHPQKFGKYIKLCNQVTILFNHLVFIAIDYTGNYTDYSEKGWTKKEYNKSK